MTNLFRLDDLRIDLDLRGVKRGDEVVRLPDLSFDVFALLIRNAPSPVGSQMLIRDVWQTEHVSDETIAQRITLLRKALGDDPKKPRYIRTVRGRGYAIAGRVEEENASFEPATRPITTKRRIGSFALLTMVMIAIGVAVIFNFDSAEENLSIENSDSSNVGLLVQRAREQMKVQQAKETDRAINMFREAINLEPENQSARIGLSFALSTRATKFHSKADDVTDAEELARQIIRENDEIGSAWHALGYALDAQGRIDEALASYQRAYDIDPSDSSALSSAAYLQSVRGKFYEALLLEARGIESENPSRYIEVQIGKILEVIDHPASARWKERAALLNPGETVVFAESVETLMRQNKPVEARRLIASSADDHGSSPRLSRLSGRVLLMLGEKDGARNAFEKAGREADFDLAALALLNGKDGQQEDLISRSKEAMLQGDSWPELRVRLAELYAVSGDEDMALTYLSQAVDLGWRDTGVITSSPFLKSVLRTEKWKQLRLRIERELEAQKRLINRSDEIQSLIQKRF